jgi:TetR/AcrR family transcriptional repressor of mexJK operon
MASTTRRRGRPAGSRGPELLDVAREVFLELGFAGATMGEVAARAHVSKASLYGEHTSKDALFAAVVLDWAARGRGSMRPALDALLRAPELRAGLIELAGTIQAATLDPAVLRMRRLVAAESERFPDVAAAYVTDSWEGNIEAFGGAIAELAARGDLAVADASLAAHQFTWLSIGGPLNAQTLGGPDVRANPAELARSAAAAVDTFLARFAPAGRLRGIGSPSAG